MPALLTRSLVRLSVCGALLSLSACAHSNASSPARGAGQPGSAAAAPVTVAANSGPKPLPELVKVFEEERATGTIALYDTQDGVLGCSDVQRCVQQVVPASTFKIPNSMIALETGIVEGPDTMMRWNGQNHAVDSWNQDLTFRDAFRLSCVPCYVRVAQEVGSEREHEWLEKLAYGNRDTSGAEPFWIRGGLRISPTEQIDFLRRFDSSQLPISDRTADIVRDIMTIDVTENYVLRGKTGRTTPPEEPRELGWFVGWLELGERRVFFATLLDGHAPGVDPLPLRRRITERVLRARGLL